MLKGSLVSKKEENGNVSNEEGAKESKEYG